MKIAHIVCTFPPYFGGMGNVVFQTASYQKAMGHEVMVLTPQYYPPEEIRPADAEPLAEHAPAVQEQIDLVKRLDPSIQYGNAARLPTIAEELNEMDLVHFHYPFFGSAGLVRKWKLKNPQKPLVLTYHMDTRASGWKGLIFKTYAKWYLPKMLDAADLIIGSTFDYIESSDAADHFRQHKDKWLELPFGVDLERFSIRERPTALYAKHGLMLDRPTVLFVGGMDAAHHFKGIPVLLNALLILKKNGLKFQAVFVGDGELRQDYINRSKFIGVSDVAHFVGRVSDEDLPYYYNLADLCVLPSTERGEAFGMVLLEAMASGVPVVASDLPGVRTVAKNAGIVVPPGKAIDLAQAILEYFSTDTNQLEWITRARAVAEVKYDWAEIVAKLDQEYQRLVVK